MQTLRISMAISACLLILSSCNTSTTKTNPEVNATIIIPAPEPIIEEFKVNDLSEEYSESVTQQFIVGNRISTVTGDKGLKLTVDPSSLEKTDGTPVDGRISVRIVELTTSDEMFRSNAATVSNGKLLSSGGSYFVGMTCNGKDLRVKKGRSITMEFPKIRPEEMDLFYGERNSSGDMNWMQASQRLEDRREDMIFSDTYARSEIPGRVRVPYEGQIFDSMNAVVYLYDKRMKVKDLVQIINKDSIKVYVDTIKSWPRDLPTGIRLDTNYLIRLYGPRFRYQLVNREKIEKEKSEMEKERIEAMNRLQDSEPQSLEAQVRKYYAPSMVTQLGWINCDRFYRYNEQTEILMDLPITFRQNKIEYFVVFRSFNGLLHSRIDPVNTEKPSIPALPVGEPVTLIAFTRLNGNVYHHTEDLTIRKNKTIKPDFKIIPEKELKKMFGGNTRI